MNGRHRVQSTNACVYECTELIFGFFATEQHRLGCFLPHSTISLLSILPRAAPSYRTLSQTQPSVSNPLTILQKRFLYSALALGVLECHIDDRERRGGVRLSRFKRASTFSSRTIFRRNSGTEQSTPTSSYTNIALQQHTTTMQQSIAIYIFQECTFFLPFDRFEKGDRTRKGGDDRKGGGV